MESIPQLDTWELISRILIAAALGGLVGFERELSPKVSSDDFARRIRALNGVRYFEWVD